MRHSNPEQAAIGKRRRTLELYATASIAGLSVIGLTASPVQAQAINATGTPRVNVNIGGASATITDSGTSTLIQVNAGQAIIDWAPNSDQFVVAGRTANFYRSDSGGFTVLNVIASGATPMHFDGRVESHLAGSTGPTGGNVWFYSPGGIIVGSGARFDVGSLLLTTINPDPDNLPNQSFASFNDGQSATITLRPDPSIYGSGNPYASQITIAPGASLTAQNYIGIVSPRIEQNGAITAQGAVGLIAAEGADLSISLDGGLFEISVPMGMGTTYAGGASDPATAAIVNTGTIGGAIRPVDITARTISMVAVPKNIAVSVLLGGSIGYADSATADGDSVLVLAGGDVSSHFDGSGVSTWTAPTLNSLPGTIDIGGALNIATSVPVALNAVATTVTAVATNLGLTFAHDANLAGTMQSSLTVNPNGILRVASGSTLTIDASQRGIDVFDGGTNSGLGGTVTGGNATLLAQGGTIEGLTAGNTGGAIRISANGVGGRGFNAGGTGSGGTALFDMSGGNVNVSSLQVSADGTGGSTRFGSSGDGTGGTASISITAGNGTPTLNSGNDISVFARGSGGLALNESVYYDGSGLLQDAPGTAGGRGLGGTASVTMAAAQGTIVSGSLIMNADGTGGTGGIAVGPSGGAGGDGLGGSASLTLSAGDISSRQIALTTNGTGGQGGEARLDADGINSQSGNGGAGGNSVGGLVNVTLSGTGRILGSDSGTSLVLSGEATGGQGGASETDLGGNGGNAIGYNPTNGVTLQVQQNGYIERNSIGLTGYAFGGNGGAASSGQAGGSGGSATGSGTLIAGSGGAPQINVNSLSLQSDAAGGSGGSGGLGSNGGAATAAALAIQFTGGSLDVSGFAYLYTTAEAGSGNGLTGGNGFGGNQSITVQGGASISMFGLSITAYGTGSSGDTNGIGAGGVVSLTATGGSLSVDGDLSIDTYGGDISGIRGGGNGAGTGVNIAVTGGGTLTVTDRFSSVSEGLTSIIGSSALTPTIEAGDISIEYGSFSSGNAFLEATGTGNGPGNISIAGIGSLSALHLQAANGISLNSQADIAIGDVTVTAAAQQNAENNLDTNSAYFTALAGDYQGTLNEGSSNGSISVNGSLTVSGLVQLTGHGSIDVTSTGSIRTNNIISLGAGGDVRIAAGGVLNAGLNPVDATDTGIAITVGDGFNTTDLVHSVINAGTINSNSMALSIYGDALQMQNGSIAGNVVVVGLNANGTIGDTDGGQLLTTCSVGSLCLGNVNAASTFVIDQSNRLPETVWLAGDISVPSINVLANNGIVLGSNGPHDINVAGNATFSTISGNILGSPGSGGTVSAATMQMFGANLAAPGHIFRTTSGNLTIDVANDVQAAGFDVAGMLGHTEMSSFQGYLVLNGSFYAGSILAVGAGDVAIQAQGITIGRLMIADGNAINLDALSSPLQVADASTSQLGTASFAQVYGASINFGALTTTNNVGLFAMGALSVQNLLTGFVIASGTSIDLGSSAAMNIVSLSAGTGGATVTAAGPLTVSSADSGGGLALASLTSGVTIDGSVSNATTSIAAAGNIQLGNVAGGSLDITSIGGGISAEAIVSEGATNLSAAGLISLPNFLSAGPISAVGGGVQITASPGMPGTQSLNFSVLGSIGGDVSVSSLENISVASGNTIGSTTITAGAQLSISNYASSGDLSLFSTTRFDFTNIAGGNVTLVTNNTLTGQGLVANGTTTLAAGPGTVSISGLDSAGGVTVDAGRISISAPNAMAVTSATADSGSLQITAGGDLTILSASSNADSIYGSVNGGITAQTLTSGAAISFSAAGAVTVASLTTNSAVSIDAGSVRISSPGSLQFANAIGRTGGVNLSAQGALTFGIGRATGDSSFTAGGPLQVTSFTTTGNLALQGTTISAFTALSGRNVSLAAQTGALAGQQLVASGTVALSTPDAITISAISAPGGVTATGSQITLVSPDVLNVASFTTTQGDASFQATNLLTVASGTSVAALAMKSTNAGLTIGTVGATGAVTGNAAGPIGFTQITGNTISLATSSGGISGQRLFATGITSLMAPGAIAVSNDFRTSGASVSGGSVAIASTRDLTFTSLTATNGDATVATTGTLTVNGGSSTGAGNFSTAGALALNSFTTGTDLILTAATLPSFTSLSGRNISLTLLSGDLTGGTLIASGTTNLATPGKLTITDLRSAGAVTLNGGTVDVGSTVALAVARATAGDGGLRLRAAGALAVANATSMAGIDLASTGGSVTAGTIAMTGTPTGISQQAVAGTSPLTIASAGTTTLNGDITGAGAATISGAGLVLNGLIDASGISLASQTIAVGPAALIGTLARTGTVAFANNGTGRSFIGGSGSANGYSLDAGALSRIQASSVTLSLPKTATSSTATPDVVIGAFTLYGTGAAAPAGSRQNLGAGSLTIATTGQVQVNGAVRLANLAGNGSGGLAIRAAGIDVVTPTGSIVQTDAAGAPGGTLDLDARIVRVASAAALTNLATLATPTAREARLALNDGNMSDTGWLSANTIRFAYPTGTTAGSGIAAIYVQNSGGNGADARRGLTTGTGGVVIADFPTSDSPEVFINGRARAADATFTTGSAFLTSISQTNTGAGAGDVLINGCVLSTAACSADTLPTTIISQLAPPQDLIAVLSNSASDDPDEDTNKPGDPVPRKDPQAIIQLAPQNPEQATQSTDDPVIGAGNDSLWNGGNAGGGETGAASFDTTIGVGNDAGPANDRPGAGGGNSGGPQQQGERTPGANPSAEGGLGIGNDAAGQRSGAGGGAGAGTVAPNAPNAAPVPGNIQNGGGIGVGGDAGGGGSGSAATNQGPAGSTGPTTPGTTTPNNRQTTPNAPR